MDKTRSKNTLITAFVVAWLLLFNYESLRYNYLNPLFGTRLPKFQLLFPPAGWIMFFRVDESEGYCEVFGKIGDKLEFIDPHLIFNNRWIGYDNIHRNVLITVLQPYYAGTFCQFLKRRFPEYDSFTVTEVFYPSNSRQPGKRFMQVAYEC